LLFEVGAKSPHDGMRRVGRYNLRDGVAADRRHDQPTLRTHPTRRPREDIFSAGAATLHTPTRAPARGGRIIAKPPKCLRIGPLLHQKPGIVTSVRVLCKGRFRCGMYAARWYRQQPKGKPDRRMIAHAPGLRYVPTHLAR